MFVKIPQLKGTGGERTNSVNIASYFPRACSHTLFLRVFACYCRVFHGCFGLSAKNLLDFHRQSTACYAK